MVRRRLLSVVVLLVGIMWTLDACADWTPEGTPVAPGSTSQDLPRIAPNGSQGAFVAWRQLNDSAADVYCQQVTHSGQRPAGWPEGGLSLASGPTSQTPLFVAEDGQAGAFVYWSDVRQSSYALLAQRVLGSGQIALGWPLLGVEITNSAAWLEAQGACPDGAGGVYVAWSNHLNSAGVGYVQHLASDGTVAPGWPSAGQLAIGVPLTNSSIQGLYPDGQGGVLIVSYASGPNTPTNSRLFAARFRADGSHPSGWPPEGVPLAVDARPADVVRACSDGVGGLFVAWNDWRGVPSPFPIPPIDFDIYMQHVLAGGAIATGWAPSGRVVSNAPNGQYQFAITSDTHGGALIVWEDYRTGALRLYALLVNGDGTSPPGWAALGNRVSLALPAQHSPRIVSDGTAGLYAFWAMSLDGNDNFFVQHMDGNGHFAPGWSEEGRVFVSPGDSFLSDLVVRSDGVGGAIGAYERGGEIWAQRLYGDGTTATLPFFVSAQTTEDEVTLVWSSSDATNLDAQVERRTDTTDWNVIGRPESIAGRLLQYTDRGLTQGRYAYRLSFQNGGQGHTEETWLDVQGGVALALAGFRPNPAVGTASIVLSLPDDRPARLDLIDVKGRVVRSRDVGSLGGGSHVLSLAAEAPLGAGMYWIKLTHLERTLTTKGLIIR
jgi:hypothetical protein